MASNVENKPFTNKRTVLSHVELVVCRPGTVSQGKKLISEANVTARTSPIHERGDGMGWKLGLGQLVDELITIWVVN